MIFIDLRDGTGFLQCILTDKQCQTYDALTLSTEATVTVYGILKEVPKGKTASSGLGRRVRYMGLILFLLLFQAPGGHELMTDFWELVCGSPAGGVEGVVTENSSVDVQLDQRHLLLRGDTVSLNLALFNGSLTSSDCVYSLSSPKCSVFVLL